MSEIEKVVKAALLAAGEEFDRVLGRDEVCKMMDMSSTNIWRLEKHPDPAFRFPSRRQVSPGRIGYLLSECLVYLHSRPTASMAKIPPVKSGGKGA